MSTDVFIPYAVFCDGFHQEADGSVTIGRVIDRITCVEKEGSTLGRSANLPLLHVQYAVCFKSPRPATGLKTELRCTRPSGKQFIVGTKILDLAGDYRGTFLTGTLDILPTERGWHVFDVVVNDSLKTRIVLHLSVGHEGGEAHVPETIPTPAAAVRKVLSHPRCYVRGLGGCSKKISREHFISKNILNELNALGGLRVGGVPWLKSSAAIAIPPSAMTGKILCEGHNHSLSILDQVGGKFFKALNAIHSACTDGQVFSPNLSLEFDGNSLERFFLKILLGGVASGNLRGPNGTIPSADLDLMVLKALFGEEEFPPATGLFLVGQLNDPWLVERHLEVAAVVARGELVGALINVAPLRFALMITPKGKNLSLVSGKLFFRPSTITVVGRDRTTHKISFRWKGESDNQDIVIDSLSTDLLRVKKD